jgi:hypothetical protein
MHSHGDSQHGHFADTTQWQTQTQRQSRQRARDLDQCSGGGGDAGASFLVRKARFPSETAVAQVRRLLEVKTGVAEVVPTVPRGLSARCRRYHVRRLIPAASQGLARDRDWLCGLAPASRRLLAFRSISRRRRRSLRAARLRSIDPIVVMPRRWRRGQVRRR